MHFCWERTNVQKALNRRESYHHLRSNIACVNQGKFRVHFGQEQQVWWECIWLMANGMVYDDTYLLIKLLYQVQHQVEEASHRGTDNKGESYILPRSKPSPRLKRYDVRSIRYLAQ